MAVRLANVFRLGIKELYSLRGDALPLRGARKAAASLIRLCHYNYKGVRFSRNGLAEEGPSRRGK